MAPRPSGPGAVRSVVVLSGGQDSSTTLALADRESDLAGAIFFDYGQRHAEAEKRAARYFAASFDTVLEEVPVSSLSALGNSALVEPGPVGGRHPRFPDLPASFVPGRNLVFLTLAAAYATRRRASAVWTGVNATDYSGYPDCRPEALDPLETAIREGLAFPSFRLMTPLIAMTKAETFALAEELGILEAVLERSHTCYEGVRRERKPWGYGCGECPACRIRADGFAEYQKGTPPEGGARRKGD